MPIVDRLEDFLIDLDIDISGPTDEKTSRKFLSIDVRRFDQIFFF